MVFNLPRSLMSGIILIVVAVILLGVAIYSLVSYVKERRASQLPTHKKKIAPPEGTTLRHDAPGRIKAGVMPVLFLLPVQSERLRLRPAPLYGRFNAG
ncbi:hypothetical protein DMH17_02170 [Raoultella planticola]|nr:hypothetical protein [Raoultella planticola]